MSPELEFCNVKIHSPFPTPTRYDTLCELLSPKQLPLCSYKLLLRFTHCWNFIVNFQLLSLRREIKFGVIISSKASYDCIENENVHVSFMRYFDAINFWIKFNSVRINLQNFLFSIYFEFLINYIANIWWKFSKGINQ